MFFYDFRTSSKIFDVDFLTKMIFILPKALQFSMENSVKYSFFVYSFYLYLSSLQQTKNTLLTNSLTAIDE